MTFDVARNRTVMFGGTTGTFSGSSVRNDTWEWDGVNWTQVLTPHVPPARRSHGLATDLLRGRVVLFGGGNNAGYGGEMNDTWEYDGNDWVQMQPANQPSLRLGARIAFDVARARTVLFGGRFGFLPFVVHSDTWEWDGVNWTPRAPASVPPPRSGHGMTYDFLRSRIVMSGGNDTNNLNNPLLSDTWTWNGTNWTQLFGTPPTASDQMGLTSDPGRDLVVRFGGSSTGGETWVFDHVRWRLDPRVVTLASRSACSLAHDVLRGRTVLFGGSGSASALQVFSDTWEYDPGTIAQWTSSGSGCAGTSGVPQLQPAGAALPIVGTNFVLELLGVPGSVAAISYGFSNTQWNGNPLPFDLGGLGMTGCTLHASPDFVRFAPVTANRATIAWSVPNDPGLIGASFFNQGFVVDPGINPLGATVSNAGAGLIGPF